MTHRSLVVRRKLVVFGAALILGALSLTACSDIRVTPTATPPPTIISTAVPTQAPVQEPTAVPIDEIEEPTAIPVVEPEISLIVWTDSRLAPILETAAEPFQAVYGLGLVVERVNFSDIPDQVAAAVSSGNGPDIFIGSHDWLGQFVSSGLLAPLDLGDKVEAFTDVGLRGCTIEGQFYCLPYAVDNLAFVYNTDLVDTPPTTWDEVIKTGSALQAEGLVQFGFALNDVTQSAFPLQTAFGGYLFGRDTAGNVDPGDIGIDGEGMIAAGNWIADRVNEGFMPDNVDWETNITLFENGELPFLLIGPDSLGRLRASGVPYAIVNFPDGGRPFITVQGFMINALSEKALLAQIFLLDFVAVNDVMTKISTVTNEPSPFALAFEATNDADTIAFAEAGKNGVLLPSMPEKDVVWGIWGEAMTLIISRQEAPETALTRAAEQIRIEFGGGGE